MGWGVGVQRGCSTEATSVACDHRSMPCLPVDSELLHQHCSSVPVFGLPQGLALTAQMVCSTIHQLTPLRPSNRPTATAANTQMWEVDTGILQGRGCAGWMAG